MFTKSSFLTTHLSPLLKLGPYFLQAVQSFELILMNSDLGFISIGEPLTKLYKKCLISSSHLEKAHASIFFRLVSLLDFILVINFVFLFKEIVHVLESYSGFGWHLIVNYFLFLNNPEIRNHHFSKSFSMVALNSSYA